MELQRQSMIYLLIGREGLRSEEYKQIQLEIRELQIKLQNEQNGYIR